MRIIIIPKGTGTQPHRCVPARRVVVSAALALLVMLGLVGAGSIQLYRVFGPVASSTGEPGTNASAANMLAQYRAEIDAAKKRVEEQLDAVGQRIGRAQAQVSRVNALGQRLTEMAGLDPSEFNFSEEPAMGGPEGAAGSHNRQRDLLSALSALETQIADKETELAILQALLSDRALFAKQFPRGWPVGGGWVSSGFGYRNDPFNGRRAFHGGVDIAGRAGSPIKAVADGVVTYAGVKAGYGLMIEINHGNGYSTRYAHTLAKLVEAGDRVTKGEFIAVIGSTGRSTGTHLHFEVVHDGHAVNPRKFLRDKG